MKNRSYEHWVIVIFMCCLSASSIGLCINSVGVFYTPVSDSLNVLRGTFAMHATLSSLATAGISLFMPKIIKRYHYKNILVIGVVLATMSTACMSCARSILAFYLLGIVRGVGVGLYGMVPMTLIITNWFYKKHGVATSIALSFSGLAGAVFSPLLSAWITNFGWQKTYLLMAVCIFSLTLPTLIWPWTIKPADANMLPYGYVKENVKSSVKRKINPFSLGMVSFAVLSIFTLLHTSITGITQHLSGITSSIGMSANTGATMMSLVMLGNIITKLLIGFISDRLTPVIACATMISVNIFSLCMLLLGIRDMNLLILIMGSFIFGSVYSVGAVGIPLLTKYFFGADNYISVYPTIGFLTNVGSSVSLTIIGYIYDFTGTYINVIIIGLVLNTINIGLLYLMFSRHHSNLNRSSQEKL